jgi:tetratricopeptide (TPR) repeat protein
MFFRWLAGLGRLGARGEADWAVHHGAGINAYKEGKYREAKRCFLAALKSSEMHGAINRRSASTLNNLGLLYKRRRKVKKAEAYLRRAQRAYEVTAPGCRQLTSVLYHLATLHHAQRQYTEAESLYQRCIVLTKRVFGENHPKLAKRLSGYARLLKDTNRRRRAAELEARAQAIRARRGRSKRSDLAAAVASPNAVSAVEPHAP